MLWRQFFPSLFIYFILVNPVFFFFFSNPCAFVVLLTNIQADAQSWMNSIVTFSIIVSFENWSATRSFGRTPNRSIRIVQILIIFRECTPILIHFPSIFISHCKNKRPYMKLHRCMPWLSVRIIVTFANYQEFFVRINSSHRYLERRTEQLKNVSFSAEAFKTFNF